MFWPLLLIAFGLIFLLQNLGYISGISWLAVAGLWPLLLVLIGLDLAFARRWPMQTLVAEVLVIGVGIGLLAYAPGMASPLIVFDHEGGTGVADASVPRANATELSLRIDAGAAKTYRLSGGATDLVQAHSANPDLRVRSSGTGRVEVRINQVAPENAAVFRTAPPAEIEIRAASDIPTLLNINVGAGEFDFDLSSIRVTDARINFGASATRVTVPKPSGDVAIRMNGGASSVVLTVPEGVEARISTTGGLLSLRSDNPRLGSDGGVGGCVACGSTIQTSGYANATNRVTVTINAGASSIVVR